MISQLKLCVTQNLCGLGAGLLKCRTELSLVCHPPELRHHAAIMPRPGLSRPEPEQGLAGPASAFKLQGSHCVKVPEALPLGSQKLAGRSPSVPFAWWAPGDCLRSEGGVRAGADAWGFWSG